LPFAQGAQNYLAQTRDISIATAIAIDAAISAAIV
jgi:hypothetical protein